MKVLALSPHVDDVVIGCGGLISKLVEAGHDVLAVTLSHEYSGKDSAHLNLLDEWQASCKVLKVKESYFSFSTRRFSEERQEILDAFLVVGATLQPDMVLAPMLCDYHQDHQVVAQEARRAFRNVTLLGYEIPWNNATPQLSTFVSLEKRHVATKLES